MSKTIKNSSKPAKGTTSNRGRKVQGNSYRDYSLMIRFNKEESEILEAVANDLRLTKADAVRTLLLREYKKIQREKSSQVSMFKD